ncbi:HU family DNA-binding protein [Bacteroides helcogenes]|uniref:DNA-binding protein n=1 Tax=Bacteroides helcogenes (strain ATCC 35417 / DSM 20613 / JCM 6297 / CCUG 15421 / P 36-108) TaxID=693979 RepID=E6ST84_BACT6|nr:HU family DNA-binding protein [Bacteroides helcogenes]ADV42215.1 DNA-binding protein [Bacteroides helcogenes P 36-108]MDY5237560.1 HU family DNA-binding protein [Bacteroides helcogenes]
MGTRYIMKEMPDLQDTGKTVTYPQMVLTGQTNTRQLAEYIAKGTGFAKGITEGVICELSEAIAHEMGMGRSVKIDGLGIFTPSLALRAGKEREETDRNATKRNAQSLRVGSVNFRADKELVQETNRWCDLERAPWKPARSSRKYTPEQRLALARAYLEENPYLSVQTYRHLTGLLQTSAATELRRWASQPDSGIGISGRGSHRVYIKRKESPIP